MPNTVLERVRAALFEVEDIMRTLRTWTTGYGVDSCLNRLQQYLKVAEAELATPHTDDWHDVAADALREKRVSDALEIVRKYGQRVTPLREGQEGKFLLLVSGRINFVSDSHGQCYDLIMNHRDFTGNRRVWIDHSEIIDETETEKEDLK